MADSMRIALGQIDTTVGDLDGNVTKAIHFASRAQQSGAGLIVFPELSITGYPPRDFVEKDSFLNRSAAALDCLAQRSANLDIALIVGNVVRTNEPRAIPAQNAAVVLHRGKTIFEQRKLLLPNYDVFDEARYFEPAVSHQIWEFGGRRIALVICEDAWNDKQYWPRQRYGRDPVEELMRASGELIITINASPFDLGKRQRRREIFKATAGRFNAPIVYVNQVGGNDQLVFDGSSFAVDSKGKVVASATSFSEDIAYFDLENETGDQHANLMDEEEAAFEALVLGTRDYMQKCGFNQALIGLSGGIDSALVASIAVEAIGKENVIGIGMPGPFSSDHSLSDARSLALNLGVRFEVVPIGRGFDAMIETLDPLFKGMAPDITEENLQSRLRGVTLMALSNKFGALVLTTGNKSELAVGYCTLYGDMCGGLAIISDVPKTLVYRLAKIANERRIRSGLGPAIPENTFVKPPSAELRPDQKDTDSLPEYPVLDAILSGYVERNESAAAIAERENLPIDLVRDIIRKVERNEYKRQQAAPGLKITTKAFGVGRRFPIAHRFTE
jgi:NAD+ synthase (glutamine-hydrolysing)